MGTLRSSPTGVSVVLAARSVVGRGAVAVVRLESRRASSEHATIYFDGAGWRLKDLGSRNGTFVNGVRCHGTRSHLLASGDALCFGGPQEEEWLLVDASPPFPRAFDSEGQRVTGRMGILWLPDQETPGLKVAVVDGAWVVESPDGTVPLGELRRIRVENRYWDLELPPPLGQEEATHSSSTLGGPEVAAPHLRFAVSLDEEHVHLSATLGERTFDLGARTHNYALLLLARQAVEDGARGVPEREAGWVDPQTLPERLRVDRVSLNVQLWRAAQVMTRAGLPGSSLIERRADSGQLRLGLRSEIDTPRR